MKLLFTLSFLVCSAIDLIGQDLDDINAWIAETPLIFKVKMTKQDLFPYLPKPELLQLRTDSLYEIPLNSILGPISETPDQGKFHIDLKSSSSYQSDFLKSILTRYQLNSPNLWLSLILKLSFKYNLPSDKIIIELRIPYTCNTLKIFFDEILKTKMTSHPMCAGIVVESSIKFAGQMSALKNSDSIVNIFFKDKFDMIEALKINRIALNQIEIVKTQGEITGQKNVWENIQIFMKIYQENTNVKIFCFLDGSFKKAAPFGTGPELNTIDGQLDKFYPNEMRSYGNKLIDDLILFLSKK